MFHFRRIIFACAIGYGTLRTVIGTRKSKDLEVHFLPSKGEHGLTQANQKMKHNHNGEGDAPAGVIPLSEFSKIFPFDLPAGAHVRVIHMSPMGVGGMGDGAGDGLLESILSELSKGFHDDFKPLLAHSQRESRKDVAHPCASDVKRFCHDDHDHGHEHMSNLHCLGLHSSEITETCANEIQHSLPFVCSMEITLFCSTEDTIDRSVLDCLEAHAKKHSDDMSTGCSESISTTRQILSRMKNQEMALVDRRTGKILKSTAIFVSNSVYVVLSVGGLLLVCALLYGIWSRDDETSIIKSVQRTLRNIRFGFPKGYQPVKTTVELKSNDNKLPNSWSM